MQLQDAVCIVTGASKGIGREVALELARRGARVVLAARSEGEGPGTITQIARDIRAQGGTALPVQTDVTREEEVGRLVRLTVNRFGQVDVLVNGAGLIGPHARFLEVSPHLWRQLIDVNLTGAYYCCRSVVPHMVERRRGCIVNISSGAAERGGFLSIAYGVSKAGLDRLTLGLAEELQEARIAVVSFAAPFTVTESTRKIYSEEELKGAQPPQLSARAIAELLAADPLRYSGRVLRWRDILGHQP